jgi:serine/threonine-protein kinase
VVYQVVYENPPPLSAVRPTVTPAVAAVVARAMAKNAAERYPTVVAFARALTAAAAGLPEPENLLATGPVPTLVDPAPAGSVSGLHELSATTLGTASGESVVRPRQSTPGRWALLAGLGLTAVVAVAVSMKRPGPRPAVERAPATAPSPPPKPQVTPLPAPPPTTVTVEIENGPPGLRVLLDGAPVEPPISLPRGGETHRLRFEAADYKPYELRVDGKRDRLVRLEMVKRRKPASGKMLLDF